MNRPAHILVVDDDDSLRESVCELLEEEGFTTSNADSGESALQRLRSGLELPDLVILDLMMPLMNGWQFRDEQVRDPLLASIPVIAMTASRDLRGIEVDAVVYKPIKLAILLDVIRQNSAPSTSISPSVAEGPQLRVDGTRPKQNGLAAPPTKSQPPDLALLKAAQSEREAHLKPEGKSGPHLAESVVAATTLGQAGTPAEVPPPSGAPTRAPKALVDAQTDQQAYALFMQAPVPICVLRGRDLVVDMANELYCQVTGRAALVGRPLLEAVPEFKGQGLDDVLRKVMDTGTAVIGKEMLLRLDRDGDGKLEDIYFAFTYAPLRNTEGVIDRVMALCNEATDQAVSRRRVEQSEEKFRWLITQQVIAGIAQTDLSGRFEFANERYLELVGRSAAELSQLRRQDLIHPDDLHRYLTQYTRLIEQGHPFVIEKRYVRPDGSIVWVQNSVVRVNDPEGKPRGIASVTMDITQRKYAERARAESEARFRSIFEMVEVSLWEEDFSAVKTWLDRFKQTRTDLRGFLESNPDAVDELISQVRVVDVNPATVRMFHAASKSQLLNAVDATFLPESRAVFVEELLAIADGRTLFTSEATFRTLSGRRIDVLMTLGFADTDDARERALVTLIDISSQRLVDREREARVAEMERAVRFSEAFVGILGHDLRNPLSAITSAASLLSRRAEESDRIAKPVGRILTSADRMERMISQLLDFTRIRLGNGIPLERHAVDLAGVVRAAVDEVESAFSRKAILTISGDSHGYWDADRLSQLVSNLAANACQHSPESTRIEISVDGSEETAVVLAVRNSGLIPSETLPDIFEPLRTGQKRPGSSGLGLGLYITQQIAIAHGGQIEASSDEMHGTTFRVVLPRVGSEQNDGVFGDVPGDLAATTTSVK